MLLLFLTEELIGSLSSCACGFHVTVSSFFLNKTIAYMEMLELLSFWCNHLGMVACIMYSMFNKLTSSDEGPIIVLVASVALG